MKATAKEQLLGRVQRVMRTATGQAYGFIVTDDRAKYFFHRHDCVGRKVPEPHTLVRFSKVAQTAEGKHDRAAHVEVVSVPA